MHMFFEKGCKCHIQKDLTDTMGRPVSATKATKDVDCQSQKNGCKLDNSYCRVALVVPGRRLSITHLFS